MLLYVVMAIFCSLGLITENRLWPMVAASLAPTGCLMAFLCTLDRFSLGTPDMGRLLGLGRASYQCLDSVLLLFRLYRAAERHS